MIEGRGPKRRVAILEDGQLMEIYYEDRAQQRLLGNVYKGVVRDVLQGLSAAFVDVGEEKNLFLSQKEINESLLRSRGLQRYEPFPIHKVLKSGQELIVQAKREGIGLKNPQGTTKISLPGRYWVFLPKDGRLGVSRRIEDEKIARRLKRTAQQLKRPDEGLIARTAAQGASTEALERDFNYLLGVWKGIEEKFGPAAAPSLLYRPPDLVKTIIRDRLLPDVERLVVDTEELYQEGVDFLNYLHLEEYAERIELYRDPQALFEVRGVEQQLRDTRDRRVSLPGGGFLVIDETEALTVIDVNTGSDVHHEDQEQAILSTNMEAAGEIPRQLRLRKLSGIIVIDFVDMKRREHVKRVIKRLQEELKMDRVPADFVDITQLGLIEITRKREGESLADMLGEDSSD